MSLDFHGHLNARPCLSNGLYIGQHDNALVKNAWKVFILQRVTPVQNKEPHRRLKVCHYKPVESLPVFKGKGRQSGRKDITELIAEILNA